MTDLAAPGPVVRLDAVGMVFDTGDGVGTTALEDIRLDIARGEFVSLIGPSGCGKSTLLRIIGDLITPTSGAATINGKPAAQARRDRDYGMVFQAPVLFDWRSIEDNVRLPLEIMGYDRERQTARTKAMQDKRTQRARKRRVPPRRRCFDTNLMTRLSHSS